MSELRMLIRLPIKIRKHRRYLDNMNKLKKREYNEIVLEVEHGSFTPLVFGKNVGIGEECSRFVSELANKLSVKQNEEYAVVISWLSVRFSLEILRSVILCVRG